METYKKLTGDYDPTKVEAPLSGIYNYQDSQVSFLRLRVTPTNRKWFLQKSFNLKHFKRQIGDAHLIGLSEARLRAYEWLRMLSEGDMPPTVKQRAHATAARGVTVERLFRAYYDAHVKVNCKTERDVLRGFESYWGGINKITVGSLTPLLVRQWMNRIAQNHGQPTASKQFRSLRAALNWGRETSYIQLTNDPLAGVKAFRAIARSTYLKPGEEVTRLMKALEPETQDVQDMILLLLWTGQRKRNVLSLRANEIDWDNRVWHIPAGKTKSSRLYSVALTSKAMEILQRRRGQCADIMFPPVHESASGHRENLNVAWYRVRERANLPQLRIHDLRHTNASWLALNGASAMVIKEALQHSSISTSQRYVHLATGDVREMMDRAQEAMAG